MFRVLGENRRRVPSERADRRAHDGHRLRPISGRGFTLIELLVVVAIIALLIAFLLPATRSARPAARRSQCVNNLKQIGLALLNYEQIYEVLPPAYTVDASGRPLQSWRTLILPYLEEPKLYDSIDLSKPWNDPANAKALETPISAFRCPEMLGPKNTTTYLATLAPDGCLIPGKPRRLAEITDPHDSTLVVIEAGDAKAVPWMAPVDADETLVMSLGKSGKLHHTGGMNAGFVDGSVKFLKAKTPDNIRRALITIPGDEATPADGW